MTEENRNRQPDRPRKGEHDQNYRQPDRFREEDEEGRRSGQPVHREGDKRQGENRDQPAR